MMMEIVEFSALLSQDLLNFDKVYEKLFGKKEVEELEDKSEEEEENEEVEEEMIDGYAVYDHVDSTKEWDEEGVLFIPPGFKELGFRSKRDFQLYEDQIRQTCTKCHKSQFIYAFFNQAKFSFSFDVCKSCRRVEDEEFMKNFKYGEK